MSPRHPSRQRLQRWLDTGETRRVDAHVAECEHCQSILEELSELDDAVVADLQTAVTPPEDLTDRTNTGVDQRRGRIKPDQPVIGKYGQWRRQNECQNQDQCAAVHGQSLGPRPASRQYFAKGAPNER